MGDKTINEVKSKFILLRVFGNPKQHDQCQCRLHVCKPSVWFYEKQSTNIACILPTDEEDVDLTARSQLLAGMISPDVLVPAAAAGDTNTVRMYLQHHPDQVRVLLYLKHTSRL